MKKNLLLKITSALLVFFAIASCQSDTRTLSEQKNEPVDAKKANQQLKEAKTDDLASFDYKMRNVLSTKSSRSYTQWSKVSKEELKQNVQLKKKAEKYN